MRIGLAVMAAWGMMLMAAESFAADNNGLVLHNGNVITMDQERPGAQAVAMRDGRIVFTGSNREALELAGPGARKIDMEGGTLVPGFNDNHTHTLAAGAFYLEPILRGLSCEQIAEVVESEARKKGPGELITGNSWDYPWCPEPTKELLDKAAPRNPVFLVQYSGHAAWVNSRTLQNMGIDRDTPDPEGGQILRDEGGEPTGVLRDTAMGSSTYIRFAKELLSRNKHREMLEKALSLYRTAGITSVQDNTWEPLTARLLARYRRNETLACRFTCWPYGQAWSAAHLMKLASYDPEWVRSGPWKYFADGAFSTRTGWLTEPYADEPGNFGEPRLEPEELEEKIMSAARHRRQIAVHAIGDRAVHEVLDAIERAQHLYPWTAELRMRIEHVQLVMPGDIERMKRLGVVACVQPFAVSAPRKDLTLLGPQRAARAYPYRSLVDAGVPVSLGSDIPAEVDYQPLLNMYYAVTRMNKEGDQGPLNPHECLTPFQALYAYTMGSAYAEFMENEKGSITEGKLADLVLLSEDPLAVAPARIKDIEVEMTIVAGRVVYRRE